MKKLFNLAGLSPVLLSTLLIGMLGTNNLWANCDGQEVATGDDTAAEVAEAACAKLEVAGSAGVKVYGLGAEVAGPDDIEADIVESDDSGMGDIGTGEIDSDGVGPARILLDSFSSDLESLQLQFTQVVKSQDGSIQDQTGGHATLQNPDMLYWVYEGDFPETIVADGQTVWIYDEALDQVTVRPQSASISDTPLMILTDISQLDETFLVTELGDFENMQLLELRSRDEESEFERIILGLDDEGIKMMVMEDAYGQRTEIRFSDIVKNAEIDNGLFNFVPPEGVDVVGEMPEPR